MNRLTLSLTTLLAAVLACSTAAPQPTPEEALFATREATPIPLVTEQPPTETPVPTATSEADSAETPTAAPEAETDPAPDEPGEAPAPTQPPEEEARANLFANPGFEGSHEPRASDPVTGARIQEMWQPQGWTTYFCPGCTALNAGAGNPPDMTTGRPEVTWTISAADGGSGRNFEGASVHFFLTGWVYFSGVAQVVEPTPGQTYTVGAWVRSDCGESFDEEAYRIVLADDTDVGRSNCRWQIKVEPFGESANTSYADPDVRVLGDFGYEHGTYGQYAFIQASYTAESDRTTVYFEHRIVYPMLHTDGWIDNALFE
ncbi:MAG: hypothetical protein ACFB51_18720 [Anaerolineae bacterium]